MVAAWLLLTGVTELMILPAWATEPKTRDAKLIKTRCFFIVLTLKSFESATDEPTDLQTAGREQDASVRKTLKLPTTHKVSSTNCVTEDEGPVQ